MRMLLKLRKIMINYIIIKSLVETMSGDSAQNGMEGNVSFHDLILEQEQESQKESTEELEFGSSVEEVGPPDLEWADASDNEEEMKELSTAPSTMHKIEMHTESTFSPMAMYRQFYHEQRQKVILRHNLEVILIHQAFGTEEGMNL